MIVSVVIPCRNEEKNIAACVTAVYESKLPAGYSLEILIVDGQSDDGTPGIISALQKKYPGLHLIPNPKRVTPVAFNLGITASTGKYIQIVGARQLIAPDYIQKGIAHLETHPGTWCIGGKVENVFENDLGRIIARAMDTPFGVGGGNFRILKRSGYVDTIGTPLFPRTTFEKIGMFDEELVRNQDDELSFRISKAGGKIFMDAEMSVKYFVRGSLRNLFRQYFQYGYWKVYVNRKHKTITTLRQLAPALFILFIGLGWLPGLFCFPLLLIYTGIIGLYLLTAFSYAILKAEKANEIVPYFKTFLALHFSYGSGYLQGIWHFLVLGKRKSSVASTMLSR